MNTWRRLNRNKKNAYAIRCHRSSIANYFCLYFDGCDRFFPLIYPTEVEQLERRKKGKGHFHKTYQFKTPHQATFRMPVLQEKERMRISNIAPFASLDSADETNTPNTKQTLRSYSNIAIQIEKKGTLSITLY